MFDVNHIIQNSGVIISLLLIGGIILAESGIPLGFFLPGDTLLFTAGFFASQHTIPIVGLIIVVVLAKIIGSSLGFMIGEQAGPRLFKKEDSFFFRKDHLDSAEAFYEKHGGKTVTLGQFFPVIRTFAPIVAGASKMTRSKFLTYNSLGALSWGVIIPLLGFWLGHKVHNIDKYLIPVVIVATIFSFAPAGWHLFGKKESRKRIAAAYKNRKSR